MKRYIVLFIILLTASAFGVVNGQTCTLSNPYFPSGSKKVGETMEVAVSGTNCGGYTVQFDVYDQDPGVDDKLKTITATFPPNGTTARATFYISQSEFEAAGGGVRQGSEGELELYFTAAAGESKVESRTVALSPENSGPPPPAPVGPQPPPGPGGPAPAPGENGGLNIKPPGEFGDLSELIAAISDFIFNISIPIAFGMIVYAGIRFLTARGDPAQVTTAKNILKYVLIGLAIVFINKGFVTLITDVLGVGTPTP